MEGGEGGGRERRGGREMMEGEDGGRERMEDRGRERRGGRGWREGREGEDGGRVRMEGGRVRNVYYRDNDPQIVKK